MMSKVSINNPFFADFFLFLQKPLPFKVKGFLISLFDLIQTGKIVITRNYLIKSFPQLTCFEFISNNLKFKAEWEKLKAKMCLCRKSQTNYKRKCEET